MNKSVRITQLDGKLPNLALMKLAHWHRANGDEVVFTRRASRDLFEHDYDIVYGSAIFKFSSDKIERFMTEWPNAIIGGTGSNSQRTVEDFIGADDDYEHFDYSIYPKFDRSIGFTQRGCRLSCKEFRGRPVARITTAWQKAVARAGLGPDVTPMTLRRTMARELRRRGVPVWDVAGLMGHRMEERTTEIYAEYDPDFQRAAVKAIDDYMSEIMDVTPVIRLIDDEESG